MPLRLRVRVKSAFIKASNDYEKKLLQPNATFYSCGNRFKGEVHAPTEQEVNEVVELAKQFQKEADWPEEFVDQLRAPTKDSNRKPLSKAQKKKAQKTSLYGATRFWRL